MSSHDARVPVAAGTRPAPAAERVPATGNAAAPSALVSVTGLTVGHADDPAEHAADRMADGALDRLHRSSAIVGGSTDAHAHDPGCGHLRRSATPTATATVGLTGGALDPTSSERIESARGGGAPLPDGVRRRMETGFGTSLGHVRVHDGAQAGALSAGMSAEAFTTGNDIFFGAGRFAPETPAGEQVLAHEIAHVLTEGGSTTRRLFGKKKTPEEKAAKAAAKREEEAKAARVKQSKKTEKTEQAGLKESRKEGIEGREALTTELYDTTNDAPQAPVSGKVNDAGLVPMTKDATSARVVDLTQRFDTALLREKEVFEQLKAKKLGGSDEKRAEIAYDQVWKGEFNDLKAVRPPRETAAERLVIQVRQARSEGAMANAAGDEEKALLKVKMLPKEVEQAYERMVTHRNDLMKKDPKRSEVLAQDEAYELIKKGMPVKDQALLPPKDGPLDQAAFTAAEGRVAAREKQAKRDADTIEENLMLLDPDKRAAAEKKKSSGVVSDDTMGTVKQVGSGVGIGKKVINTVGGGIAGMVGTQQDKGLRAAQHITKEPTRIVPSAPSVLDQGVTNLINTSAQTHKQVTTGQRSLTSQTLPQSDATKAKFGIGQVTGILGGLMTAVQSAFEMVKSAETAWTTKDPYEALKATKAGAVGLDGLVSVAKNSADLAKLIDSGVSEGVKQVIPGLDIAASALAMVRGVTEVASAGMRQRETDLTMFEARAGSGEKVNVMVYPLMKVSQVYTKHLEQQCWSLGVSIINFSTSVAQVASAGGFGVPAAIKAAAAVIDNLHKIAHYIASKLLNQMAKTAEKESAVMHLEGGAEDELKKHPKMAVDGIIMKAAGGDKTAQQFLANYRIDGKPITPDYVKQIKPRPVKPFNPQAKPDAKEEQTSNDALLIKIRAVVLAGMDTNADPQSMFEDLKKKVKPGTDFLGGVSDAWAETDELAQKRNQQAKDGKLGDNKKTDRGLGWRIQQLFRSEHRGMLKEKTSALGKTESLPSGVVCVVGDLQLKDQASPPDIKKFTDALTVQAIEAELKRTPRRNAPEWIEFLREALRNKAAKSAPSRPSAPAPTPWVSAQPSGKS